MGQSASRTSSNGEIIPLKVFLAVEDAIQFIKQNAHVEGLFRCERGSYLKPRIFQALKRGDRQTLNHLLYPSSEELARIPGMAEIGYGIAEAHIAIECSSALISLLMYLPKPLFPLRVQRLVLGGNEGVPVEDVARDALGLLKQDLVGCHFTLVSSFLDLLYTVSKNSRFSELGGPSIAASLLPILFTLEPDDVSRWQHSAAIFSELISMSPRCLSPGQSMGSGEADDSSTIATRATPSNASQDTQGPPVDVSLPAPYANSSHEGRRRQRRRSSRRCVLTNFGGPDAPLTVWRAPVQGMLHPVMAGYHH